ncbi:MAG: hypothetical protein U9O20_04520 [Patescibacteria group bacterium]|nr:hypothetical protein [Patescibacteria group bacterium]
MAKNFSIATAIIVIVIGVVAVVWSQEKNQRQVPTPTENSPVNQNQPPGQDNQQQANNQNQQQNNQNNNNGQQQVVDPYEGWQTHKNEEWGFEIKYPSSIYIRDCSSLIGFSKEIEDITGCGEGHETLTPINIVATIYDIGDGPDELLQKNINYYDEALGQKTKRVVVLDGIQATEFSGIWKSRDEIMKREIIDTKTKMLLFVNGDYVFSVALDYYNLDEDAVSDYESIFDDIVSTFKFQQ